MMRAKFIVTEVSSAGAQPNQQQTVAMRAVTDSKYGPNGENEDNTYARYTPAGSLSITVNNPTLIGQFRVGQKFYLDFTEATQ